MSINFPIPTAVGQTFTDSTTGYEYICERVGPPAQWVSTGSATNLDASYLRLDASNDPVTSNLEVSGNFDADDTSVNSLSVNGGNITLDDTGAASFLSNVDIGSGNIELNADGNIAVKNTGFCSVSVQTDRANDGETVGGLRMLDTSGNSVANVYGRIGGRLTFETAGQERARITETGSLYLGDVLVSGQIISPKISLNADGSITATGNFATGTADGPSGDAPLARVNANGSCVFRSTTTALEGYRASSTATDTLAFFRSDVGVSKNTCFLMTADGSVSLGGTTVQTAPNIALNANGTAQKPGGGSWSSTSDERAKEAIVDYTGGLAEVKQLQPRSYRFIGNDNTYIGLVAQETESAMPEMVSQGEGTLPDGTEVDDFRTLDSTALTFALVNAVKEMSAEIDSLKARLDAAGA